MAYITFQPSDHFNTVLYTGNGSTQSITGVGFQPDWCWIKGRGSSAYDHQLFDAVRGATKAIASNDSAAEATYSNSLTSFDSDGFSLGDFARTNSNSDNKVSWNWKANGQGSSNTDGSINTTYTSVNTTTGFSISKYTGTGSNATIGHGLGTAPKMIIIKNLTNSINWHCYHSALGGTKVIYLSLTNAAATDSTSFNNTGPTTSVFSVGTDTGTNQSGSDFIAYCFAEKKGFSKFGSFSGNGSANGNFIYCGFKPAFIMFKDYSNAGSNWVIHDNKRNTFNVVDKVLKPSANDAESTSTFCDFVSNGFKVRTSFATSVDFLYMAFAEHPLVSSNNIPATAR